MSSRHNIKKGNATSSVSGDEKHEDEAEDDVPLANRTSFKNNIQ